MKQLRKTHRKWLDKTNPDQIDFTRTYLKGTKWLSNESDGLDQLYEQLIQVLNDAQDQGQLELIDTLRRKWREEKIKISFDTINIRITKIASKQLKLLSKEKPKNKVIEDMILKEGRTLASYNRSVTEIRKELHEEFKQRNAELTAKYSRLKKKLEFDLDKDVVSEKNRQLEEKLTITQIHLYRTLEELTRCQAVMTDNHLDTVLLTDTQKEKSKILFFEQLQVKYLPDDWKNIKGRLDGFVPLKDYPCQELENSTHTSATEKPLSEQVSIGINTDEASS